MPADAHEQGGRRCVRVVPLCVHERVAPIVVVAEGLNCLVQCLQTGLWPQLSPQTNAKSFISWSATLATSSSRATAGEACRQVTGQQHWLETRCRGPDKCAHGTAPSSNTHAKNLRLKPCDSLLSHGAPPRLERVALCHHNRLPFRRVLKAHLALGAPSWPCAFTACQHSTVTAWLLPAGPLHHDLCCL
jgi:hypothetical protein